MTGLSSADDMHFHHHGMGRRVDRGPGPERGPADATLPFLHTELEAWGASSQGFLDAGSFALAMNRFCLF